MLRRAHPSGKSGPYRLKVNDRLVRSDHRYGVCNGGDGGVTVEAFEVLPHRLALVDDGVRAWWPAVGLRNHLHVDGVEH